MTDDTEWKSLSDDDEPSDFAKYLADMYQKKLANQAAKSLDMFGMATVKTTIEDSREDL